MKHIKLFEAFVNEAKVDAKAFEDEFASVIFTIEERIKKKLNNKQIAQVLIVAFEETCLLNKFKETSHLLPTALIQVGIGFDPGFKKGQAWAEARGFAHNMVDATGGTWPGIVECFEALFITMAGAPPRKVKLMFRHLTSWFNANDDAYVK